MRKNIYTFRAVAFAAGLLAGCGSKDSGKDTTIVVGASPAPHAEILEAAKPVLEKAGYTLEIKEYNDYVQPNVALDAGDLDANYFQHQPYLDEFNAEKKTELASAAVIHYEPFGIYAGKTASLEELADGAQIAVPNDTTNEARALLLLEAQGLIGLKEGLRQPSRISLTIREISISLKWRQPSFPVLSRTWIWLSSTETMPSQQV